MNKKTSEENNRLCKFHQKHCIPSDALRTSFSWLCFLVTHSLLHWQTQITSMVSLYNSLPQSINTWTTEFAILLFLLPGKSGPDNHKGRTIYYSQSAAAATRGKDNACRQPAVATLIRSDQPKLFTREENDTNVDLHPTSQSTNGWASPLMESVAVSSIDAIPKPSPIVNY